ncbi:MULTISPECIES: MFS transporter [unclassified Microbacterium]|uniref:MFS transporter n=1 Tax=unclassified Microbacterium TaxID=2609290 RepID=UPI000CFC7DCA|nr:MULTISPECIES: MFS transporter [unclassified Microbacterium]PQZ56882.1 MFS transporter [Microbacterium sp. MYb43]PQZ79760.1 MFS transporter [Microbacterium sp. MYb40]PRB20139.1 MFS transporter [Microbacterium sp. MYb54]PRB27423.1 MFS transporter [Microbacterium sp. MYb50]PRB67318.1 MFS transporter [Microbacterium sp. MYb24]
MAVTDPRTSARAVSDDPEYAANLRRATLASSIGSALEYFDFALYGLSTALIFNVLFFPQDDPAMATVAAFATFGVGFLARPFGGLFFGVLGDKLGRKWVLVATIVLMGGASTAIGLLPTYAAIGVWAPILLVLMRLLQGFGAGAEQAGATVLMAEYAPVKRRGFFSALPFVGIQAGTLLAAVVFGLITLLPEDQLLSWGWRVPFLASFALILLALFIRMRLRETPTFVELEKHEQVADRPIKEIFTHGLPGVIVGVGLRMAENGGSYMFQTLGLAFFVTVVGESADKSLLTWGVTLGSLIGVFSVPFTGHLSDRFGRRTVYRFGAVFMLVYTFPAWWLLSLGNYAIAIGVIAIGIGVAVNSMLGPQCAMLPELFGNRHRYLGVAMAREISAVLAGGLAGVLGAYLIAVSGGNWVLLAIYMAVLALITVASTFLAPETLRRDLTRVDDAIKVSRAEGGDDVFATTVSIKAVGR